VSYFPQDHFQLGDVPRYGHRRPPRRVFGVLVIALAAVALFAAVWRAAASGDGATTDPTQLAQPAAGASSPAAQDGAQIYEPGTEPVASVPAPIQKLIDYGKPVYCGGGTLPMVALTFDDGPGPYSTYTMDMLRASGAKATFFLVSKLFYSTDYQKVAKQEARFGDVGDHSHSHFGLAGKPPSVLQTEVAKPKQAIERYSGQPVIYFRPPWGSRDAQLDDYVRSLGMLEIMWTFDTYDSEGAKSEEIAANVAKHATPGAIILMHENRGTTKNALPMILQALTDQGLQPVTLTTMLTQDPPTKQQLRQGLSGC